MFTGDKKKDLCKAEGTKLQQTQRLKEGASDYQRGELGESRWGGREKGIWGYHDWCTWSV